MQTTVIYSRQNFGRVFNRLMQNLKSTNDLQFYFRFFTVFYYAAVLFVCSAVIASRRARFQPSLNRDPHLALSDPLFVARNRCFVQVFTNAFKKSFATDLEFRKGLPLDYLSVLGVQNSEKVSRVGRTVVSWPVWEPSCTSGTRN